MSSRRGDVLHLAAATLVLAAGIWASTGTLAPYAATLEHPFMWAPCNYPLNIDHFHFKATFLMLDGAPREQWEFSVVLRRLLYPLLAYVPMKLLGYGAGGLVTNVALAVASLLMFARELRRRLGTLPPAALWLLATYPGFAYWAGLPYSYACIVPFSLLCQVLLWRLDESAGWQSSLLIGLALGVLFTGYDLLPIFGAGALLLLAWRRRWLDAAVVTLAQIVPTVVVASVLWTVYRVPLRNGNTEAYFTVARSYVSPVDLHAWWTLLRQLPQVIVDNYFFSNFFFLPLLFVLALLVRGRRPVGEEPTIGATEGVVLLAAALLFLFNNLAPPYVGWPLRGSWVARLYQPVVSALVTVLAGLLARRPLPLPRWHGLRLATALTVALQAATLFGPVLGLPWLAGQLYYRFYRHARRPVYAENVERLGARPVGFCASPASAAAAADSVMH